MFILILKKNLEQSFFIGFFWGLGFFFHGLNWIYDGILQYSHLSILTGKILTFILCMYLSLYPAFFSTILNYFFPESKINRFLIGTPLIWLLTESARGYFLTGFSWLELGYSQIDSPFRNLAPILGVKGITFFILLFSSISLYSFLNRNLISFVFSLLIIVAIYLLGLLKWYQEDLDNNITVAMIQGNINNIEYNNLSFNDTINKYLQYTFPLLKKAQIIIWPESALFYEENIENKKIISSLNKNLFLSETKVITGIVNSRNIFNKIYYYNSILVLGNQYDIFCERRLNNWYDKHYLVLFGEKLPFEKFLKPIFHFFHLPIPIINSGNYLQPQLDVGMLKFTAAICYEIIFGDRMRDNFHSDTDFLISVSNDIWFSGTIGPWQHLQIARMRALEFGRPLFFSTNNGITAVIYADGSINKMLKPLIRDVLLVKICPTKGHTIYAKKGYLFLWIFILIKVFLFVIYQIFIRLKIKFFIL